MARDKDSQVINFETAWVEKNAGGWHSFWDLAGPERAAAALREAYGTEAVPAAAQCALAAFTDGRELDCAFWWSVHTILRAVGSVEDQQRRGASGEPDHLLPEVLRLGEALARGAANDDPDPVMARLIAGDPRRSTLCISRWGDPLEAVILAIHLLEDPLGDIMQRMCRAEEAGRVAEAGFWRRACRYLNLQTASENE